jgi:cytoskeletal protein CcmA (bactofilin family)
MTTIGPSLVITGELTCAEDVTIHGQVKGNIRMTQGALLLAPTGNVEANVQGARVTVHGKLTGDATAEKIELTATANVTGTITAASVVLLDGATFNGLIDMGQTGAQRKPRLVTTPAVAQVAKAS